MPCAVLRPPTTCSRPRRPERGARPVTRLFHQALTDELLAPPRHQPSGESALLDMLLGQAEHAGWQDRYLREHAAEHGRHRPARSASGGSALPDHCRSCASGAPPRRRAIRPGPRRRRRISANCLPPHSPRPADAGQPARTDRPEARLPQPGPCIANAVPDRPWRTHWSHGRAAVGHQPLRGHDGPVYAVAAGKLPDGTMVIIISGGHNGTVRVWRLADGTPVGQPLAATTAR